MLRKGMSWVLLLGSACALGDPDEKGPRPVVTSVTRVACDGQGDVAPEPQVYFTAGQELCVRLRIDGSGLSPMPGELLTDQATLLLPQAEFRHSSGLILKPTASQFLTATKSLLVTLKAADATAMPLGFYDLTVTNPNGNQGSLAQALNVVPPPPAIDLCPSVDPAFGWVDARTTVQLCADNAAQRGLVAIPEVFLLVPALDGSGIVEVPLIREAFLSASTSAGGFADASVMSAVVPARALTGRGAGIEIGGPYDIKVVNPDGAVGVIPAAFEVLADPPPTIMSVSPEQAEKSAAVTMRISGENLKDPTGTPAAARILFLATEQASGATCTAPTCYACTNTTVVNTGTVVDCQPPLAAMASGAYLVRYEHTEDGSFADFAAFAITNPSGNLASTTSSVPALTSGRWGHGAAYARDDLGNRFLYTVGGRSGITDATLDTLDTVEVAALDRFGGVSAWRELSVRLPKKLTGLGLVAHDGYLFAVGGRDETDALQAAVYRARILGIATAPEIGAPTAQTGGSLAEGTYSYRIAAMMAAGTDNVGGESLPSDAESVRVIGGGAVQLSWTAVNNAASYRIYRTAAPNGLAGSEVLLADGVTGTSYLDDGSATPGVMVPQPPGALGVWMTLSTMLTARAEHGVTIASDTNGSTYLYVLGGRTAASLPASSTDYEFAEFTVSSDALTLSSFVAGNGALNHPRAEFPAVTLSGRFAPLIEPLGQQYVLVAQGLSNTTEQDDVSLAKVGADGQLEAFQEATNSPAFSRFGSVGFLVNNYFFSVGGRQGAAGYETKGKTAEVCPARDGSCATADPPVVEIGSGDSGITLSTGRYRSGGVYVSGYFYFLGGRANATTVLNSCERGGYAQ